MQKRKFRKGKELIPTGGISGNLVMKRGESRFRLILESFEEVELMKHVQGEGTKLARGEDIARELVMDGPRIHTLDADRSRAGTRDER